MRFDASGFSDSGLLMQYNLQAKALINEDNNPDLPKEFNMRGEPDHKEWSDCLEAELEKRGLRFDKAPW